MSRCFTFSELKYSEHWEIQIIHERGKSRDRDQSHPMFLHKYKCFLSAIVASGWLISDPWYKKHEGPHSTFEACDQGVKKRCRLSLLTNSALDMSPNAGGRLRGLSQWVQHITWHGAQINVGDLPPYLTYACDITHREICPNYIKLLKLFRYRIRWQPSATMTTIIDPLDSWQQQLSGYFRRKRSHFVAIIITLYILIPPTLREERFKK
jgi:hypothetical protein